VAREELKEDLWNGRVDAIIEKLGTHSDRLGPPQTGDGPEHPRRVVANNVGYFTRHKHHMDYPEYREKGWPNGPGMTEAGVKQFNKRVKGTEQFWSEVRVEAILALRALWLSQDDRWGRYWTTPRPLLKGRLICHAPTALPHGSLRLNPVARPGRIAASGSVTGNPWQADAFDAP